VHRCTKSIQVYIRLTHLVGKFTAYKCGTKPQRLFNEGASHTIECMCSTIKGEKLYTPYLLSEGENLVCTVCIQVEKGVFCKVYVWYDPWEF